MNRLFTRLSALLLAAVVLGASAGCPRPRGETREITEYRPPASTDDVLVDDRLEEKRTSFDPELVHPDPIDGWSINLSDAVIRLDVPLIKPDQEGHLLVLSKSYAAARTAAGGETVLPSVNMIDGKAKQFDDGLYAALDQAYYQGLENVLTSHVELVKRVFEAAGPDSPAAPFLAAGLELAGQKVELADTQRKQQLLDDFLSNDVLSKPTGFYTWNDTLQDGFRFLRFFQQRLDTADLPVAQALAATLKADSDLRSGYRRMVDFYGQLSNPAVCLSLEDIADLQSIDVDTLGSLAAERGVALPGVAFLPPSTSREDLLFQRLFGDGLPPGADLMRELVSRIRSGEVDLSPVANSGWYDYQACALETLLLPERGEEHNKLLLTKSYKKRMLEAFQALITKRRETHARQIPAGVDSPAAPPAVVAPRLRVEPCPTYFVRTARAYAFLLNFLEAAVGEQALATLNGLTESGPRTMNLYEELRFMRDLFYGLYLVSSQDIGHRTKFLDGEQVDVDHCHAAAVEWLKRAFDDADLAADTRVCVPIFVSQRRGATRLWVTLGVRLARLEASFAREPHIRPVDGSGDWEVASSSTLRTATYLIPVDEFAEVELAGNTTLTRQEFRAVCDQHRTKEAIVQALRSKP